VSDINRLVLNFPGFETTDALHQIGRLSAGGQKTAHLWGFELEVDEINSDQDDHKASTVFHSSSEKWRSKTDYVHFSWTDIIGKYENMPYPQSFFANFPKYLLFFLDGSVRKYAKASMRYWGFAIYPMLMMLFFAVFSWFFMHYTIGAFGLHWIVTAIAAFLMFLVLCRFPGDLAYLNLSINDWGFARDLVTLSNPEIADRYALFADHLSDEISNSKHDEILIVGHSFGSVWAVSALAIALENNPDLLVGKRVTFLALGSSLLKIALVKRAVYFDKYVKTVLAEPNILWHEIQTKTDFISFYKTEPFLPLKILETVSPVVTSRVNFKHALSKERHSKMKRSMYLAHRQYILYHDNRVHHDFQLRVFGPFFADDLARDETLFANSDLIANITDAN
jgi:pimeloyl-ACP methyl ester carboxylesterase